MKLYQFDKIEVMLNSSVKADQLQAVHMLNNYYSLGVTDYETLKVFWWSIAKFLSSDVTAHLAEEFISKSIAKFEAEKVIFKSNGKWIVKGSTSSQSSTNQNICGSGVKEIIIDEYESLVASAKKRNEDTVRELLVMVGEDPERGGLQETPARVVKAWKHWTKGYNESPADILKVFEDGAENVDQMVVVKDIPIYSHCEHHLAPIFGTATIAYIPNGKIVGLSKLSRLADCFARRLQVQERLTNQIADSLQEHLNPIGVGVYIKARHMCMESRGICQQGHHTITTALRGAIKTDPASRAEFLAAAR